MKTYDEANTGAVQRARQLRRDSTGAEKLLWRALRSKLPQFKWRRQMPIGPYFADFACFAGGLVIELDGGQHAEAMEYDEARDRFLAAKGYLVLRFWNNDVLSNTSGVLERIAECLAAGRANDQRQRLKGEWESSSSSPSRSGAAGPSLSHRRGKVEACQ